MGSAFFEFNIAMSGLFASQRGLAVTGNNITSAATPGYSRQVLRQKAGDALPGHGIGMLGTGVVTTGIDRIRNSYLDTKMWGQNDKLGEYTIKQEQNAMIEGVFGEPSDAGFTKVFDDFFSALDDLSKLPTEAERKQALRQTMISFTQYYNKTAESLKDYQRDLNFEVKSKVDEINMLATRIQSLNKQIYDSEIHGDSANTLRDERDLIIDRLSQLINVDVKETTVTGADGRVHNELTIMANGQPLVDHFDVRLLDVKVRADKLNPEDENELFEVVWQDGLPFDMSDPKLSGELKGAIDMRDGRGSTSFDKNGVQTSPDINYKGIPYYIHRLDNFVQGFAKAMNDIYNQGPGGTPLVPPQYMFEVPSATDAAGNIIMDANGNPVPDYSKLTADKFRISEAILESANNIRTNFEEIPGVSNPNPSNNDLLLALVAQKNNKTMFGSGDAKDFMISMFSELGINSKEAQMYQKSQKDITDNIERQRLSVSQVSTDEEFMNLVKYNQAYQAAAKIMTTMDEIYETTIMRLGRW
ncbi:MAG: flagellar hook-associated protein FlgK [Cellulosilyticaceae bacterium]